MKTVKRALALVLALTVILTLSIGAFAASGVNDNSGKITIDNAIAGQTYTIYQILTLESYSTDDNAYSYKATDAWKAFVERADIKDAYLTIDDQGYVTWKGTTDDSRVAEFSALAQTYATTNKIAATKTANADSTKVTFDNLNLGYYLLDSSLGTLCSLDTTHTEVTIKEKNQAPTNEKKVEEDSTGNLGSVNDADIGQMVKFVSEVTLPAGSQNITFHDKMSAGLTLVIGEEGKTGITVYKDATFNDDNIISDGNWPQLTPTDGCTFEIDLSGCVGAYDKVYVVYYATVNENAVVGGSGNPNESWLSYGEDGTTTTVPSKTTTYTWEINVYKYTMVKATEAGQADTEKALAGAQFVLYKTVEGVKNYAIVDANNKITGWTTNAHDSAESVKASVITTPANGKFTIAGLDSDTYYLEEIVAPAGYNVLKAPVEVVIDTEGKVTYGEDSTAAAPDVKILNKSGAELPSTGGIGTTVFYVLGGLLVVCAGVLLITKRRMNKNA